MPLPFSQHQRQMAPSRRAVREEANLAIASRKRFPRKGRNGNSSVQLNHLPSVGFHYSTLPLDDNCHFLISANGPGARLLQDTGEAAGFRPKFKTWKISLEYRQGQEQYQAENGQDNQQLHEREAADHRRHLTSS
jgi:hypothetical protein